LQKDHSPSLLTLLRGFYAVEQFVPDYTGRLSNLFRANYGRSQHQLHWGAEEAKHADVWKNALLFSGATSRIDLDLYDSGLRDNKWELPWSSHLEMLFYTVLQERATELTYLDMAKIGRGHYPGWSSDDTDPVLVKIATAIAVDEAAHYRFFLEGARLYLYYFPEEALDALTRVIQGFAMPAIDLIYDYSAFSKVLTDSQLYSSTKYARFVVIPALKNLGIASPRLLRDWQCSRLPTSYFVHAVERSVQDLYGNVGRYEDGIGLRDLDPLNFISSTVE